MPAGAGGEPRARAIGRAAWGPAVRPQSDRGPDRRRPGHRRGGGEFQPRPTADRRRHVPPFRQRLPRVHGRIRVRARVSDARRSPADDRSPRFAPATDPAAAECYSTPSRRAARGRRRRRARPSARLRTIEPAPDRRSGGRRRRGVRGPRSAQRSVSKGPTRQPSRSPRSVGAMPTGVESTATSHARASTAASPKPSLSEVIRTAFAALTQSTIRSASIPPPDRQLRIHGRCELGLPGRGASRAARGRPETAGTVPPDRGPRRRRASGRDPGAKLSRSAPHGRTALAPATRGSPARPDSGANRAREAPAIRSSRGASRRDRGPTTGWRTSVPWNVTISGLAPAAKAHHPASP